jgi:hypothetical protein
MELVHNGVFNTWTEKSLSKLAEMMPGRYAKREASTGFLDIDNYVYKTPVSQIVVPPPAPAPEPTAAEEGAKDENPK